MQADMHDHENLSVQASMEVCTSQCNVACSYACMQTSVQASMQSSMPSSMHDKAVKKCQLGLSNDQINIISIIKNTRLPLSYKHIADILNTSFQKTVSADAVRGSVNRLRDNGFIESQYASLGSRRGNIYTVKPLACPSIPMLDMQADMQASMPFDMYSAMQAGVQTAMQVPMQAGMHPTPSSFKDRIDSKLSVFNPTVNPATNPNKQSYKQHLESLLEDDIKFHFENLAKNGFGTSQIQQIIMRLGQLNIGLENVMQGLTHAEWDLEHAQMKDKHGELIKSPTNWVFRILAKQGYYPRPKNYISPTEQIELDAKIELEALKKAKKEFEDEQYKNWLNSLSEEKKCELMEEQKRTKFHKFSPPEDVILRNCYVNYLKNVAS